LSFNLQNFLKNPEYTLSIIFAFHLLLVLFRRKNIFFQLIDSNLAPYISITMIIYPQISSLRLIIVPLTIALLTLGYYSYESHSSIKEYENFIEEENNFVAVELNEMINNYNELSVQNDSIMQQLDDSRFKISRILDSVYSVKPDLKLVAGYKKQLKVLKEENKRILDLVYNLNAENQRLKQEALLVEAQLENSNSRIAKFTYKNSTLSSINSGLEGQIKEASILKVTDLSAVAIRRQTSKRKIPTTSARRAKFMSVCFTIPANKFAPKGMQEFYVQIIDPDNNVLGDRGEVTIAGSRLIKSKTLTVNYSNTELEICDLIIPNKDESFTKGLYYVSLYSKNGLIDHTKLTLK